MRREFEEIAVIDRVEGRMTLQEISDSVTDCRRVQGGPGTSIIVLLASRPWRLFSPVSDLLGEGGIVVKQIFEDGAQDRYAKAESGLVIAVRDGD